MISKEREADILRLFHAEKWRVGTIATQLGLHHTTVQRVLAQTGLGSKEICPRPRSSTLILILFAIRS